MAKRDRDGQGRWLPGTTGNPSGRPKDAGAARRLREAMTSAAPSAALTLAKAATAGDIRAAALVLQHVLPALKAVSMAEPVTLRGSTLSEKARSAILLIESGELTAETGRELIEALTAVGKLVELVELQERVAQLETALKKQNEAERR